MINIRFACTNFFTRRKSGSLIMGGGAALNWRTSFLAP